jgi:signal peptidase I
MGAGRSKGFLRDYVEAAIIAVLLSLFVRTFLFEAFKIPTPSMESSLMVGDHVIVDKFALAPRLDFEGGILPMRPIRRGDVVVFKFEREPEKDYVKRVVGLPGDEIKVENKMLYVNGALMNEPYVQHVDKEVVPERDFLPTVKVPPGHYFVMGDNRDNSADSREWGFVPRGQIKGRAVFVYWSLATGPPSQSAGSSPDSRGRVAAGAAAPASASASHTRWDRTFRAVR